MSRYHTINAEGFESYSLSANGDFGIGRILTAKGEHPLAAEAVFGIENTSGKVKGGIADIFCLAVIEEARIFFLFLHYLLDMLGILGQTRDPDLTAAEDRNIEAEAVYEGVVELILPAGTAVMGEAVGHDDLGESTAEERGVEILHGIVLRSLAVVGVVTAVEVVHTA